MDDSLKQLEAQLENLVPRALSDDGRERCHTLLDELASGGQSASSSPIGLSWMGTAAAAAVALGLGLGGGWYFGLDEENPLLSQVDGTEASVASGFELLDHDSWLMRDGVPGVYVAKDGEIREISQETEVTKEVVKHRESGVVVTIETTDHHLIDTVKSEF
ncbi:MAG: hypothetical protein ACJAQT_003274 [Akkermansiaceae bacterium]|jgi:hypothetical protein